MEFFVLAAASVRGCKLLKNIDKNCF